MGRSNGLSPRDMSQPAPPSVFTSANDSRRPVVVHVSSQKHRSAWPSHPVMSIRSSTVGRYLGQWHTMTRTGMVQRLNDMHPEPRLEMHPEDAKAYGVDDNGLAAITSRRGTLTARVTLTDRIRRGSVFLPMHWGFTQEEACEANTLMHDILPNLKTAGTPSLGRRGGPSRVGGETREQQTGRLESLRRRLIPALR